MGDNANIKKVVGLEYKKGEGLPRVILKGSGKIADSILKSRRLGSGPAVVENKDLVDKLYRLPIDAEISEDLFGMVAIILAHILSVDENKRRNIDE